MLQRSAAGFGYLALQAMLGREGARAAVENPLAPKQPQFAPRAKRVVFLLMKGGPSHVDTFDPKPLLTRDHGKPYPFQEPRVKFAETGKLLKSPWNFQQHGQSGLPVSELFPNVAQHVDDLCIVRSMHGTNPAHGGVNNWGAAFLPAYCQGTPIGNASIPSDKALVRHIRNELISATTQRKQLDFLAKLNREHLALSGPDSALEGRINSFELAYRMQSTMPEAQDVAGESDATKKLYGMDQPVTENFGRQCLMARRFLERGVRFVQVTHSDGEVQWDQHSSLFKGHTKNAAEVDKPIAGFLTDLKSRGLLEDTLVLWGGEFGRTPTAQGADGRDHNPHGFTMWMAGGGVKPGIAYGATDDYGYYAQEDKVHIHDLHATILHLLGINHEKLTYKYAGRDFRLTDIAGHVVKDIIA
jgi:hypothetical protein